MEFLAGLREEEHMDNRLKRGGTMRFVQVDHGDQITLDDRVTSWLERHNVPTEVLRPWRGDPLPEADGSVLGAVVYGGKYDVFKEDRFPFLHAENLFIEQCLRSEIPVLGICQGAQSMARVLGAACGPLDPEVHEFGYYEIRPTEAGREHFPEALSVAQAHYHGFDIPHGATRLASSDLFPNQAMQAGPKAFAFQFHAEVTEQGFRRWQNADEWNAYGNNGAQSRAEQDVLLPRCDPIMGIWFDGFIDTLYGEILSNIEAA
ncbi:MAG: glutamine amidotransferase [Pseudomonadota bacterium]